MVLLIVGGLCTAVDCMRWIDDCVVDCKKRGWVGSSDRNVPARSGLGLRTYGRPSRMGCARGYGRVHQAGGAVNRV